MHKPVPPAATSGKSPPDVGWDFTADGMDRRDGKRDDNETSETNEI
jgi:hypothetical protein